MPVDAAVNAIQKIFSNIETVRLKEYRLEALTGDSEAVADVTVKVEDDAGNSASGRGMKRDIVVASVEAIVAGTNALPGEEGRRSGRPGASRPRRLLVR